MATYSFKSSGKTSTELITETQDTTALPIGLKTPLRFGSKTLFECHYTLADQMSDNLRNLLLTNWGERLGRFNYGANLKPLLSNYASNENFDSEVMSKISDAVRRYMPFIDLENFSVFVDRSDNRSLVPIHFTITYNILALNVKKRSLELIVYAM